MSSYKIFAGVSCVSVFNAYVYQICHSTFVSKPPKFKAVNLRLIMFSYLPRLNVFFCICIIMKLS